MAILRTALAGAVAVGTMVPIYLSAAEPEPDPDSLEKILVVGYLDPAGYLPKSSSTATGLNLSLRETPQSVTVITRARMDDQATHDIHSVLKQAAGVNVNPYGSGSDGANFYSRGFQVRNFQLDGTPRPPFSDYAGDSMDMALYERVEIVRGATGLMSGAGSPGAAINLVRKRPSADGRVSFEGELGSHEHQRAVVDLSGALNGSGSVRGRTVLLYQDADSFIARLNSDLKVIYGIVEVDLPARTLLTAGIEYQDAVDHGASIGGIPAFFTDGSATHLPRDTNTGAEWNSLSRTTTRFFASLRHSFNNGWSVKLEGEESHPDYDKIFSFLTDPFDANTGAGAYIGTAHWTGDLQQRTWSITASGTFQWLGHEQQLALGGNYSTTGISRGSFPNWWCCEHAGDYWAPLPDAWDFLDDGVFTPPDLTRYYPDFGDDLKQTGVYAALRLKPTDRIATVLGLRVSDFKLSVWNYWSGELSTTTFMDYSNVLTPYAGVLFDLTKNLTAYASYTDIFEPQIAEDPEGHRLDPAVGSMYEIGLKREFREGRLYAAESAFRTEQDNLAVPIPDAPPNPNGNYPFTAEDGTVSQGYELEVVGELSPGWQIGGSYAYAKAEDARGMALLTEVPKDTFKVFGTYRPTGALKALRIGGNVRWQGKAFLNESGPNGEDFVQGSQFAIDLMAYYKVTEQVSLSLHVNNVTDEVYYSGINWQHGFYEAPRNFLFGFRWDL